MPLQSNNQKAVEAAPTTQPQTGKVSVVDPYIRALKPEQLERLKTMTEAEFMEDTTMEAIPFELPSMLAVKLKDPLYIPRWVNWKGHGGANYGRLRTIGFEPCTEADIEDGCLDPNVFKAGTMGRYEYYDVVLMKIHKLRYFSALKANLIKSRSVTAERSNIMNAAQGEANNVLKQQLGDKGLASLLGKVSTFIPNEADANSLQ